MFVSAGGGECRHALLQDGGPTVLAGRTTGEAVLSIHLATDGEADAAVQETTRAGGVVVKAASPTPMGGSYAFADPDGHLWEVTNHPLYRLGTDGRPEVP